MEELLAHKDQPLAQHLAEVGERAARFAAKFNAEAFGRVAGELHDLGKAEAEFQKRVRSDDKEGQKQPHAHHGAALALSQEVPDWVVALAINGHHAGLHNRGDVEARRAKYGPLALACVKLLRESPAAWSPAAFPQALPQWLARLPFDMRKTSEGWFAVELFTRFLFSALVDADRLNTEEHERGRDASITIRRWPEFQPALLLDILSNDLSERAELASRDGTASHDVQWVRGEVGRLCAANAASPRGLFTLTVPTGGGKTLASMLFALAHAAHHNQSRDAQRPFARVIVVIPYLNIIQQTAKVLGEVFGEEHVLEHHSQVEEPEAFAFKKEREDGPVDLQSVRRRLAAENWDAPIVVTTSAQFFGSLFSRRPAAARKLHNICQSVIIFDEVQTLPPLLMQPLLSVLRELANPDRPYGCSLVFATATQPALGESPDLPYGLAGLTPIIAPERAVSHFSKLSRVNYVWPAENELLTPEDLAREVVGSKTEQALVVVNTKRMARDVHAAMQELLGERCSGLFHLSTWMTPAHRVKVLDKVRQRLASSGSGSRREQSILVSTQCIEAGVDVDFPYVWREFGPYDAIVQAGGRCNRNGRLPLFPGDSAKGRVRIVQLVDSKAPGKLYRAAISQTRLLRRMGLAHPDDPQSFEHYFRLLYQLSVPDECEVQHERARLRFEEVDRIFNFIDDETSPVVVLRQTVGASSEGQVDTPAHDFYEAARKRGFLVREDWRRIQPYVINLRTSAILKSPFSENIADNDLGVRCWVGSYDGGVNGVGVRLDGLSAEESVV